MGLAMPLARILPKRALKDPESDPHLNEEWLVTNGLGVYASGTVSGALCHAVSHARANKRREKHDGG